MPDQPLRSRALGSEPLEANGRSDRLVRYASSLGLSQKETAERLGIDPGTLARWERGERKPTGALLGRVKRFLCDEEAADLQARLVG
jgi:transcriptional regulator with XRE-family HTH domain